MAVSIWSSSARLMLPVVVALLAMAMAAEGSGVEDVPAVQPGGRFPETRMGRKLLDFNFFCGTGTPPNFGCTKANYPFFNKPACCGPILGFSYCFDVGAFDILKCGSCTTVCPFGTVCCYGTCANLLTSKTNCGLCGVTCPGNYQCRFGLCKYG